MIGEWLLACQVVAQMKLKDGEWRLGDLANGSSCGDVVTI